jgi:hypothetical protein
MPLTSVVDYYNVLLPELHSRSYLRHAASYRLHRGAVTAQVACFRIRPYQVPVVHATTGERFGHHAQLLVQADDGQPVPLDSLYTLAWDAEDVLFLDCFLRTFQALNHLQQGHDERESLVLDVPLRHEALLPEHQGPVLESLLLLLGLRPNQVVLRLDARTLHWDTYTQGVFRNFARQGYLLLATRPDLANTDWGLLRSLGVRWVVFNTRDSERWQGHWSQGRGKDRATAGRIGLWLGGVDSPKAHQRAQALGADLIEECLAPCASCATPPRHPARPVGTGGLRSSCSIC